MTLSDFLNLFSDDECGFVIINNVDDNHNMILSKHQVIMMHEDKLNNVIKRVYPYAWNWEVLFEINVYVNDRFFCSGDTPKECYEELEKNEEEN